MSFSTQPSWGSERDNLEPKTIPFQVPLLGLNIIAAIAISRCLSIVTKNILILIVCLISTNVGKVNTPAARRPSHASSAMGEKLVQAVLMLQQTILDVHLLFFKPARPSVAPSLKSLPVVSGLVLLKQLEFISDIDRALTPLLSRSGTDEKKGLEFDASAFIAHDKTSASPLEIRKIFDQWLGKAVQKVGERARAALEAMESATEVARLQQRVWLCCTTVTAVTTSAATSSIFSPLGYSQADWDESCIELLSVKKRRSFATETNCAATGLLWSRVFRLPFMLQVERLLRESCMGVLRGAKGLLLQSLAQEGVHIDPITLAASLRITSSSARSSGSGSGSGSGSAVPPPFGLGLSYSYSTLCSPSPRIFRKAEAVRCLLQDELSDLLRDIIVPVSTTSRHVTALLLIDLVCS